MVITATHVFVVTRLWEANGDDRVKLPQRFFIDLKGTIHQGFGLGKSVCGVKQLSQVVEVNGNSGVIRPKRILIERQRAAHEWFGFIESTDVLQYLSQVVEANRYVGMLGAESFYVDLKGLAYDFVNGRLIFSVRSGRWDPPV